METLTLKAVLQEIPVDLEQQDGSMKSYKLRELTGEERDAYLDGMSKRFKMGSDGKVTAIENFKGLHTALLSKCLVDTETEKLVTPDVLRTLPATAMTALFEAASKLSALNQEGADEAKND